MIFSIRSDNIDELLTLYLVNIKECIMGWLIQNNIYIGNTFKYNISYFGYINSSLVGETTPYPPLSAPSRVS